MSFAQDLRASVLQAAMQGKLTEQLETDTSVSELLADIKVEKDKLIAEKKIKKEKPLSVITDDDAPFDIPENWEYIRLGNLAFITSGGTPSRSNPKFWNGNIPWVKIGDMSSKYLNNTEETISQEGLDNSSAKYFEKGTILYSIFASIGTVSILNIRATTNQAIAGIMPYGNIDTDYLYYILVALKDILVKQSRGCAQLNINQEILKNTPIPIPPIEEQKRIVQRIEEIMRHIDELEAIEEELKKLKEAFPDDMKAAVLQAAMQGKLTQQLDTDSSVDELLENIAEERENLIKEGKLKKSKKTNDSLINDVPFDIPNSWKWVKIGDLLSVVSDGTHKTPNYVDKGVPFLSVQNISTGSFTFDKIKYISQEEHNELCKRIKPENGDILLCRIGTLGKAIKNTLDFEFSIFVSLGLLRPINPSLTNFLIMCINSPVGFKWIQENKVGGGTHTFKINLNSIPEMLIPLPPFEEQQRIVDKLETILPLIENI